MKFALPMPPSTNNLFATVAGNRRIPSREYKAWREEAAQCLMVARARPVVGPVVVRIVIRDKGTGDADNRLKAVLDLCVQHGLIDGDGRKTVREINIKWGDVDGAEVEIVPALRVAA